MTSYSTQTLLSTAQWLDHYLLQRGQMYTNATTRFYYQPDSRIAGYNAYSAPFRSFVWDSGISGANILGSISGYLFDISPYTSSGSGQPYTGIIFPQIGTNGLASMPLQMDFDQTTFVSIISGNALQSGSSIFFPENQTQRVVVQISGSGSTSSDTVTLDITGTPTTLSRGENGMMIDFVNGRVLFSGSSVGTSAIISGSYSFKDFNIYFANQGAEKMVFSDKYYLNSRFARPETGIPAAHDMVTPCIFVTNPRTSNSIRGFGGEQDTQTIVTLYVMAETQGQLENALSLLASSRDLSFPQLPPSTWPLNLYGDYKSGYSYPQLRDSYSSAPKYTIVGARSSKVSDSAVVDESVFVGQVDLTLHMARNING